MTEKEIQEMVISWGLGLDDGSEFMALQELIRYLDKLLFSEYDVLPKFKQRLNGWLGNVEKVEEKKSLYQLIPNLFFVGSKEFKSLYKTAFEENYLQWLFKTSGELKFDSTESFNAIIQEEVNRTAFTKLTDSMNLNDFYHANGLINKGLSIDWYADVRAGGEDRVASSIELLKKRNIERVVILDDHVGSGSQMDYVLNGANTLFSEFSVLVIPLLCGKTGYENGMSLARALHFMFKPVLIMNEHVFISAKQETQSNDILEKVKQIAEKYEKKYIDENNGEYDTIYGFGESGSLLIMHTNCPNNTMPLIHSNYDEWTPLFPRQGGHR
ncbi:MAG: hypothetical protein R3E73_04215 [Porticoccaceae bacterium]|nr:hypothetical protein [Pseudomonadales bacterium]MCP5172613.1 hypothetical protein [Pseudomonadales bacterium]